MYKICFILICILEVIKGGNGVTLGCTSRNIITNYRDTLGILNHRPHPDFSRADLRGGLDWVGNQSTFEEAKAKKIKYIVNIIAEIKGNNLDSCLNVISTLWYLWCNFYLVVLMV